MRGVSDRRKVMEALAPHGCSVLLVTDPATITCLADIEFPFAAHFPERPLCCMIFRDGAAVLAAPHEWIQGIADQGWDGELVPYSDGQADALALLARSAAKAFADKGAHKAGAGIEVQRLPAALAEMLKKELPSVRWTGLDASLLSFRSRKTGAQLDRLKTAAEQLEFGIIAALQHLEGSLEDTGYTAAEFCERIRVHVYESGGTAGGMACAAAGDNARLWWGIPRGKFVPGELVRVEATSCYRGYWANASRMITMGEASVLQARAYRENLELKQKVLELLRPGAPCGSIYERIVEIAQDAGVELRSEFGIGHGIGVSEREAPYLSRDDGTPLAEDMCMVVSLYTEGPQKELICSKDTYRITAQGPVCISSFHDWEAPYPVTGFRSAH